MDLQTIDVSKPQIGWVCPTADIASSFRAYHLLKRCPLLSDTSSYHHRSMFRAATGLWSCTRTLNSLETAVSSAYSTDEIQDATLTVQYRSLHFCTPFLREWAKHCYPILDEAVLVG